MPSTDHRGCYYVSETGTDGKTRLYTRKADGTFWNHFSDDAVADEKVVERLDDEWKRVIIGKGI